MGLLRRAMLEAGRRIGLLDVDHAVELTVAELIARLGGAPNPTADDAAERAASRRVWSSLGAPLRLGPEPSLPPLTALPRPLARIVAAQLAAADHMATDHSGVVGIGEAPYTGRALVVDDPTVALGLMEPGDVVVTDTTTPTWNVILAHAGALVTTTGGLMSHAAVIARELGIPALIGEPTASRRLVTGTMVTVDPRAGTVLPAG
jgi:pyruvate,water dikinase